jgi:hypothetical protein
MHPLLAVVFVSQLTACRSAGGSEGFLVESVYLIHKEGTETTEVSGNFERHFAGQWSLHAWSAAPCTEAEDPQSPEGAGWEEVDPAPGEQDLDLCEVAAMIAAETGGASFASPSKSHRKALTLEMYDYSPESNNRRGYANVMVCRSPNQDTPWEAQYGLGFDELLSENFDDFEIDVKTDSTARIRAAVDDRLKIDWTMRYCVY